MSYTWRSILKGIDLLKEGIIWRIGDGEELSICEDPWLPRSMSRRLITPRGANILSTVFELIDPSTGTWDDQLVQDTFWEEDPRLILARLDWHFDKKGLFS